MVVDSVEKTETTAKYIYVCLNPRCSEYKKAQTATGELKDGKIQ